MARKLYAILSWRPARRFKYYQPSKLFFAFGVGDRAFFGGDAANDQNAMIPDGGRVAVSRTAALWLSVLVAALGATVLAGWALDVAVLKSIVSGGVTMKPNAAMGMLLTGTALALLSRGKVGNAARMFALGVACGGIVMGILTLWETFFAQDLRIDQWLFAEAPGAVESTSPGRLSPPAAFSFVLAGIALALISRSVANQFRAPAVAALGVAVLLIGGLGLAGHLIYATFEFRFWNYTGLAPHTAAGLFLLGCAFLAWARGERDVRWGLDVLTTAGFVVGIVSIIAAAGMSYTFTDRLRQDASLVAHSQEVLKEIQELNTSQRDLTLSLGRYIITHDELAIAERPSIKTAILEDTNQLQKLIAGDSGQQGRLEQVRQLTVRRIALSDQIIEALRHRSASNSSPLGTEYPAAGQETDRLLKEMEADEYGLLQKRLAQSESSATLTFLLMPVGVYLSFTILLLGLFFLNSGAVAREGAEEARRESESYFHTIFEAAPDGMIIADRDRQIIVANAAAEEMFGYPSGKLAHAAMEDLVPGSNREMLVRDLSKLTADARQRVAAGTREIDAMRMDGSTFPVELTRSVFDIPGKRHVLGVVRDITERKQVELTRARLAAIVESSEDAIIGKDINGIVTSWNAGATKVFGYTTEEMTGHPIAILLPPDRLDEEEHILARIRRGELVEHLETVRKRKDGRLIDVSITVSPIRDGMGNVVGASKIARDITERKKLERSLRESERRFSNMLGTVELASVMLDREAGIMYCNDYLLRLTGWQREEVMGRNWFDTFMTTGPGYERPDFPPYLDSRPEAWLRENEIYTRARERRILRWSNSVLRSDTGEVIGVASIGEDITEQKRAEDRIRRLNRIYEVLSGINNLIVRTRSREELFREACRIAVDHGAFKMAWIGEIDLETLDGEVVAWCGGEESYFEKGRITARDGTPDSERPACRALRLGQPVICNDIATDPSIGALREDLLARGHKSIGCFPLILAGRAEAVLCMFAGEAHSFDEEEMRLLRELAGDISFALDHIQKSEHLDYLAYYDELTGLANRTLFRERLDQLVNTAKREGKELAVGMLDIERFKAVNEGLGRQAGDDLLKQIAERGKKIVTDAGWLGRVGADHFAVVFPEMIEADDAARRANIRYHEIFDAPFVIDGTELRVAARYGIAVFPSDGTDADILLRNAEAALKKAKTSGERYLFYTEQMTERVAERLNLESSLRRALENHEFVLHYQPKFSLESRRIVGVEALIRWNDPATGLVPPAQFIGLLEETGLILEVGNWALGRAVLDHQHWLDLGLPAPRIAVNVSPLQLRQGNFVETVRQVIASGISPPGIDLEITESLIMDDVDSNIGKLRAIREMGLTIYIDDFGTGYSSLGYLAKLPIQSLKIDRSFVITMLKDANVMTLVSTIVSLAHSLKLTVVAEGIDEEEQAQVLCSLRCEEGQGFLFSKPIPRDALTALLRSEA